MNINELSSQVKECARCSLRGECTAPVPGIGNEHAKYFIIGEAPGKHEDEVGVPFVGLAGKRLDKLIRLANIDINDCYLTNVCKCRPPENRIPRKAERLSCYPWLRQELELIKPEYIITLGSTPLSLFSEFGVRQMHGTMFEVELDI